MESGDTNRLHLDRGTTTGQPGSTAKVPSHACGDAASLEATNGVSVLLADDFRDPVPCLPTQEAPCTRYPPPTSAWNNG